MSLRKPVLCSQKKWLQVLLMARALIVRVDILRVGEDALLFQCLCADLWVLVLYLTFGCRSSRGSSRLSIERLLRVEEVG